MKTVFICLLLVSMGCYAQTPTETANRMFEDLNKSYTFELGKYYHSEAQKDFRNLMEFVLATGQDSQAELVEAVFGSRMKPHKLNMLSDEEFLSAFLEHASNIENSMSEIKIGVRTAIGEVYDADGIAYVVTKTKGNVSGSDIESYDVQPYKQENGVWKALLNTKIKMFAMKMKSMASSL